MAISATALLRLQEAANPMEPFSSPDAARILYNYAVNNDEGAIVTEAMGYILEWALVLYDPGDVWIQYRGMVEALTSELPGVSGATSSQGLAYVSELILEFSNLLIEIFVTPDLFGIAPLPANVLQRVSDEIANWSGLVGFPTQ